MTNRKHPFSNGESGGPVFIMIEKEQRVSFYFVHCRIKKHTDQFEKVTTETSQCVSIPKTTLESTSAKGTKGFTSITVQITSPVSEDFLTGNLCM